MTSDFHPDFQQLPLMPAVEVNCLLLDDDLKKVFTVELLASKHISTLKKFIKAEKAPHLDHLAASDLILWKVR